MGRNDFGCMVNLFIRKIKFTSFFICVLFISAGCLFAQENTQSAKASEPVKYLPVHKFPLAVQHVYMFTDTTEVTKTFPDSTRVKYYRELTHFFTVTQNETSKDGFVTVEVTIDSTRYHLKDGKAEIFWDSQDENAGGVNLQDLMYASVPLGKYFDMTYSPYGEIAKISGEKMDAYFDYLNKNSSGFKDEVLKYLWFEGASIKRLANITDVIKIVFPDIKMGIDSIWKTPFNMQLDFINITDTLDARITDVTSGEITIDALSKSVDVLNGKYIFYGVKNMLLPVTKSSGGGTYRLTMSPRGAMKKAIANFDVNLQVPVQKDIFSINIKSSVHWVLLGQYKQ